MKKARSGIRDSGCGTGSARASRAGFGASPKRTSAKRSYDNQISTMVRALDAIYFTPRGLRALARLQIKWPVENWPQRLAEIHVAVISEPEGLALPPIGGFR